ncbi:MULTISPECIES: DUF4262 domain-containing protein [Actinoplanes]|uniref:DUF4262 domain-containing protein n=1 Tax=Actinoplanes TaxID=1865 RepID=UPI0007C6F264|nr:MULTISPECIES: DUF4262 domain-containing protein [Actinoplanes]GLY01051.1 hypothetical protein Acsp01_14300 [Actinoplanes sp. NBRC 101535]
MSFRDDFFQRQSEIIEQFGWAVVHVLPDLDDPDDAMPFAYTVGLTEAGLPELTVAGLPPETGQALLNELATRLTEDGVRLRHGQRVGDLLEGHDVVIVAGEPTDLLFPGAAVARYGGPRVRLRQIVWPDPWDHFPWQEDYESAACPQPTIGRPERPAGAAPRCAGFRGFPRRRARHAR